MMTKSERRQARIAAARARDAALLESGSRDPMLLDWLRGSRTTDPRGFARAIALARREAARPSSPDRDRALVALGGLRALIAHDTQTAVRKESP